MGIREAYYESKDLAFFITSYLGGAHLSYLVKFDLTLRKASFQTIRGLDEEPNNPLTKKGFTIQDAFIIQSNSQTGNLFAKGFIVGRTKNVSSYNYCDEPDFGFASQYDSYLSKAFHYGFVERIELDPTSCKRELV